VRGTRRRACILVEPAEVGEAFAGVITADAAQR